LDKIIQWLTGGVIKEVGGVIDKLTTTKEEKLEAKRLMVEILEKADSEAQSQVTGRWESDMASDCFFSKNIRPSGSYIFNVYIYCMCIF